MFVLDDTNYITDQVKDNPGYKIPEHPWFQWTDTHLQILEKRFFETEEEFQAAIGANKKSFAADDGKLADEETGRKK